LITSGRFENRIFWIGGWLTAAGSLATALIFGWHYGISFLAGGALSALNLKLLIRSVNSALARSGNVSHFRIATIYILRLLLIPLCLYAIMHFFFFGIIAATAGFVVFSSGILIEGILETVKSNPR
jgi:hypothetical protein